MNFFRGLTKIQKRALIGTPLVLLQSEMKKSSPSINKKKVKLVLIHHQIFKMKIKMKILHKSINLNILDEDKQKNLQIISYESTHSEYQVGRNYLETLMDIKLQKILPPLTIMKNNILFLSNLRENNQMMIMF